jgi:HPt (histidine-containing phosphotransfer) domain-containing protein
MTQTQLEGLSHAIDVDDLISRCMGNLDFVERILTIFQTRCEADLEELEAAIKAADFAQVQRIAHRLKGACANAGAGRLSARAGDLWNAASKEFADVVAARFAQFKEDWEHCSAILNAEQCVVAPTTLAST